ncbi:endo alpha-1,4 polygalactosaminidase [Candidatus Gracilibacteria bacterium]|nr:endo alpha-1,4 polygalactosaminidase [Candidatus Gracilibacteria bacterium]
MIISTLLVSLLSVAPAIPAHHNWYHPEPGISWQWQLSGPIDTSYKVDLYDVDLVETPQKTIDELHAQGSKVICYFSAGSVEKDRADAKEFPKEIIGKSLDGWPDENWLDVAHYQKFSKIMRARLDLAVKKNCDGVEPDNIDAYLQYTGFTITNKQQLQYNRWLARQAHRRGLAIALKNNGTQAHSLSGQFDFAIVEQCFEFYECNQYNSFIEKNKAVLGVEYELDPKDFCPQAKRKKFSWLKMTYELDGGREACE